MDRDDHGVRHSDRDRLLMADVDLEAATRHLTLAAEAIGLTLPAAKAYPGAFEGTVSIAWPHPGSEGSALNGWRVRLADGDGRPVLTVSDVIVHADPVHCVWAELTMFADEDGRPALDVPPIPDRPGTADLSGVLGEDGEIRQATFAFLISGMSVDAPVAAAVAAG
jgi:hypothetical protein